MMSTTAIESTATEVEHYVKQYLRLEPDRRRVVLRATIQFFSLSLRLIGSLWSTDPRPSFLDKCIATLKASVLKGELTSSLMFFF